MTLYAFPLEIHINLKNVNKSPDSSRLYGRPIAIERSILPTAPNTIPRQPTYTTEFCDLCEPVEPISH